MRRLELIPPFWRSFGLMKLDQHCCWPLGSFWAISHSIWVQIAWDQSHLKTNTPHYWIGPKEGKNEKDGGSILKGWKEKHENSFLVGSFRIKLSLFQFLSFVLHCSSSLPLFFCNVSVNSWTNPGCEDLFGLRSSGPGSYWLMHDLVSSLLNFWSCLVMILISWF